MESSQIQQLIEVIKKLERRVLYLETKIHNDIVHKKNRRTASYADIAFFEYQP